MNNGTSAIPAPVQHHVGRHVFQGQLKRFTVTRSPRCPRCGAKTRREAFFDSEEVHLYGVCRMNKDHPHAPILWVVQPPYIYLSPVEANSLGFAVYQ